MALFDRDQHVMLPCSATFDELYPSPTTSELVRKGPSFSHMLSPPIGSPTGPPGHSRHRVLSRGMFPERVHVVPAPPSVEPPPEAEAMTATDGPPQLGAPAPRRLQINVDSQPAQQPQQQQPQQPHQQQQQQQQQQPNQVFIRPHQELRRAASPRRQRSTSQQPFMLSKPRGAAPADAALGGTVQMGAGMLTPSVAEGPRGALGARSKSDINLQSLAAAIEAAGPPVMRFEKVIITPRAKLHRRSSSLTGLLKQQEQEAARRAAARITSPTLSDGSSTGSDAIAIVETPAIAVSAIGAAGNADSHPAAPPKTLTSVPVAVVEAIETVTPAVSVRRTQTPEVLVPPPTTAAFGRSRGHRRGHSTTAVVRAQQQQQQGQQQERLLSPEPIVDVAPPHPAISEAVSVVAPPRRGHRRGKSTTGVVVPAPTERPSGHRRQQSTSSAHLVKSSAYGKNASAAVFAAPPAVEQQIAHPAVQAANAALAVVSSNPTTPQGGGAGAGAGAGAAGPRRGHRRVRSLPTNIAKDKVRSPQTKSRLESDCFSMRMLTIHMPMCDDTFQVQVFNRFTVQQVIALVLRRATENHTLDTALASAYELRLLDDAGKPDFYSDPLPRDRTLGLIADESFAMLRDPDFFVSRDLENDLGLSRPTSSSNSDSTVGTPSSAYHSLVESLASLKTSVSKLF